jgi:hypothetical protein
LEFFCFNLSFKSSARWLKNTRTDCIGNQLIAAGVLSARRRHKRVKNFEVVIDYGK